MDDARIQAILASYNNEEEEIKTEEKPRSPSPPNNLEDYIDSLPTGLKEWPSNQDLDDLENLNLTIESVGLGGLDDIINDLSTHAPFDTSLLDDLERQVVELENQFSKYSSQMLALHDPDKQSASLMNSPTARQGLSPSSVRALSEEYSNQVINKKESNKQARYGATDDQSFSKSIQKTMYPGFFPQEMTPLPGQIEALQLLNSIVKAQNIMPAFRKILTKLFLSESSVAILQADSKKAQDGLFNRISDSFVSLFFGVPQQYKDRFFMYYPDCISQAIYSAYCQAFPRSYSLFDEAFKTKLLNTVSEWMTGTKPPPHAWKQWDFRILEPANIRDLQDDRTESLKVDMSFDIDAMLDEGQLYQIPQSVKRHTMPQLSASKMVRPLKAESHQIGPGPDFERVNFNIFGQSPLVSHYLKMKQLTSGEGQSKAIARTEIAKPQPPAPTYRQVLDETKRTVKSRNINYQRLKTDLVLKNQDIKIISEKLVDLVSQPDYGAANNFAAKNVALDDEDD